MKIHKNSNFINKSRIKRWLVHFHYIKWKIVTVVIVVLVCLMFLQSGALWREGTVDRLAFSYIHSTSTQNEQPSAPQAPPIEIILPNAVNKIQKVHTLINPKEYQSVEIRKYSAAYAMKGIRPSMEDRFVINENVNNTDVGFFAIFDGHGGNFVVNYIMRVFVPHLYNKITNIAKAFEEEQPMSNFRKNCGTNRRQREKFNITEKTDSFINYYNQAQQCLKTNCQRYSNRFLLKKLHSTLNSTEKNNHNVIVPSEFNERCYIEKERINFGNMLMDELYFLDYHLLNTVWKMKDKSGSTLLIAITNENILTLANIGDTRAVLCDKDGNAVQMTVDHKASTPSEQQRILELGGFIGWDVTVARTLGTIAITRAIGDYHLKKFLITEPDIYTYDLKLNKPRFLIIGCDGIWERFSNAGAVAVIKEHFQEHDFGAESLAKAAFKRNSYDNLTVVIIVFKDGKQFMASYNSNEPR